MFIVATLQHVHIVTAITYLIVRFVFFPMILIPGEWNKWFGDQRMALECPGSLWKDFFKNCFTLSRKLFKKSFIKLLSVHIKSKYLRIFPTSLWQYLKIFRKSRKYEKLPKSYPFTCGQSYSSKASSKTVRRKHLYQFVYISCAERISNLISDMNKLQSRCLWSDHFKV